MSDLEQDRIAKIRARLTVVENQLFGAGSRSAHILDRDGGRATASESDAYRRQLMQERSKLLGELPATGIASGQRLVVGRVLGTTVMGEIAPDVRPEPYDRSCPFERNAYEMGWAID